MTSAHFILSDLYISDDIRNQEMLTSGGSDDSDFDDDQVKSCVHTRASLHNEKVVTFEMNSY